MEIFRSREKVVILFFIIALAFFLRFYQLSDNPPGLDWDEVSNTYNGYSIAKTGRDEYKQSFPVLFRAFDAYVPPVLIYINAISSSLFGLNSLAARFPIAFSGTLSILGIYLLVSRLTANSKWALFAALILSISPWHIIYSRVGTIASLPIVFIIFGTYFFIKGLTQKLFLVASNFCFVMATLSYFAAYIFVPLYLFALVVVFRKRLAYQYAAIMLVIILGVALIPFVLPGGQMRLRGVSAFSDPDVIKKDTIYAAQEAGGKFLHNRRLVFLQLLLEGYFSNFNFAFLFNKADTVTRFNVPGPGFGLLYWMEFPLLLTGTYLIVRNKPKGWCVLLVWLLLAPLPAAPTLPRSTSTRAILMIPVLSMFVSYGLWYFSTRSSSLIRFAVIIFFSANVMLFMHQYFVHYPKEKSDEWYAAYKPLFSYLNQIENRDRNVIFYIQEPDYLDEVHMFTAFYGQINPQTYQDYGGTHMGKLGTTGEFSIGRFYFIPRECIACGKYSTYNKDDLVVLARELPIKPVVSIPQNSHPFLFVYKIGDVPFESIVKPEIKNR